jgi:hypothetical protein
MPYTIMTGPAPGQFDSAHDVDANALKMARELIRQGQKNVRIFDDDGKSFSAEAFEHLITNRGGSLL